MGDVSISKIQRIKELYQELAEQFSASVFKVIELGDELLEVKDSLDHGQLKPWIEENFPFSYRTAVRYMNTALNKKDILKQLKGKKTLLLTDAYGSGVVKAASPKKESAPAGAARRGIPKELGATAQALWDRKPSVPLERFRVCARGGTVLMKTPDMRNPIMVCSVTAEPIRGCEEAYEQLNEGLQVLFEQYYATIEAFERGPSPVAAPARRGRLRNVTETELDSDEETE